MKRLAMLLAVCLLVTMLPAGAVSEGVVNTIVEEAPGEAVGDTGAPGLIAESDEWQSADEDVATAENQTAGDGTEPKLADEGGQSAEQGDTPAEDKPAEQSDTPAEDKPAEQGEAPAEGQPAEQSEAPAEDKPVEKSEAPAEDKPAEQGDTPAEDKPAEQGDTPAEDKPAEQSEAPAEGQPAEQSEAPAEGQPAEPVIEQPVEEAAPVEELPVQEIAAPAEAEPVSAVEAQPETVEPTPETPVEQPQTPLPPHMDPNGPQLIAYDITLGSGETIALNGYMPAGREGVISYSSPNTAIATVTPEGVVMGLGVGDVRLTAMAYDGTYAECDIHVRFAPEFGRFSQDPLAIGKGEIIDAPQAVFLSNAGEAAGGYTLSSSNPKILAIGENNRLKGLKRGTAVLTATAYNGVTASCAVTVLKAPRKVILASKTATIGVGESVTVAASLPKKSASRLAFASENPAIVAVDPTTGVMQGVAVGSTRIRVSTFNGKYALMTVTVLPAPQSVSFGAPEFVMGLGMAVEAAKVNAGAAPSVSYNIANPGVVAPKDGMLYAIAVGETDVTATTYNGLSAACKLIVKPAPQYVSVPYATITIGVGESIQLQPSVGDSASTFTYKSSSKKKVSVTADGVVTGLKKGKASITIKTYNKKKCKVRIVVQNQPTILALSQTSAELTVGAQLVLRSNIAGTTFASADANLVQVDAANGIVTAVAPGSTEIIATAPNGQQARCAVTVKAPDPTPEPTPTPTPEPTPTPDTMPEPTPTPEPTPEPTPTEQPQPDVVLTIPSRATAVSAISDNLGKIDAIRRCAINQIDALRASGTISDSDAGKRRSMVNNAFADYAFPWMTPAYQPYWKEANSEGGVKDFKPGLVYYGLPYISGSGENRLYNVSRALSEARYTDSGSGYYLLNQGNLLKGKYCGNDCSGFVDAAIWGLNHKRSADRTSEIAKIKEYRTIDDYGAMRTGDLICKSSAHVVMFLYYTNAEKTQFMIIENGGAEPGTNTVHCIIMDADYYKSKGYNVRRLASLG